MVAVFNKELLSWYLITLKLRETVDQNISKSGPSTPSNPPTTPIPTAPTPSSQPQFLLLTNGESQHECGIVPDSNLNLNQVHKEGTFVQVEHAPTQITTEITAAQSIPTPIPRSPRDTWVIFIKQKLQEAKDEEAKNPWSKLSIYRVPKSLWEGDEKSYMPQMVSIGPFHHGRKKLREMEPHKWRAVHHVLERKGHDIHQYINAIRPLEERIRSCYEGRIAMRSDEFLLSLVLSQYHMLCSDIIITQVVLNQLFLSWHDETFNLKLSLSSRVKLL